jgi:hypothetical protein
MWRSLVKGRPGILERGLAGATGGTIGSSKGRDQLIAAASASSERTSFPNIVSEMALAHKVSDKVEGQLTGAASSSKNGGGGPLSQ